MKNFQLLLSSELSDKIEQISNINKRLIEGYKIFISTPTIYTEVQSLDNLSKSCIERGCEWMVYKNILKRHVVLYVYKGDIIRIAKEISTSIIYPFSMTTKSIPLIVASDIKNNDELFEALLYFSIKGVIISEYYYNHNENIITLK